MIAKANIKMGDVSYQFEVEEKDEKETLNKIITFANPRSICDECGAKEGFRMDTNRDKEGNIYINVVCKCGAKSKLGSYRAGGFFWNAFEKWTGEKK